MALGERTVSAKQEKIMIKEETSNEIQADSKKIDDGTASVQQDAKIEETDKVEDHVKPVENNLCVKKGKESKEHDHQKQDKDSGLIVQKGKDSQERTSRPQKRRSGKGRDSSDSSSASSTEEERSRSGSSSSSSSSGSSSSSSRSNRSTEKTEPRRRKKSSSDSSSSSSSRHSPSSKRTASKLSRSQSQEERKYWTHAGENDTSLPQIPDLPSPLVQRKLGEVGNSQSLLRTEVTDEETSQSFDVEKERRHARLSTDDSREPSNCKLPGASVRKLQITSRNSDHAAANEGKTPRKRRWGFSTKVAPAASLSISTDSLKDLIPDYNPVLALAAPVEELSSPPPPTLQPIVPSTAAPLGPGPPGSPESAPPRKRGSSMSEEKKESTKDKVSSSEAAKPEELKQRRPSPPRNPPSSIIHIRNLVRPFTLLQLKEMLGTWGPLVESGFWIDKIKSKCYVTYEHQEHATAARESLHGSRWPVSNPRILIVDFASRDELDFHKDRADVQKPEPINMEPLPRRPEPAPETKRRETRDKRKEERPSRDHGSSSTLAKSKPPVPIREWDRDKVVQESPEREKPEKGKPREKEPARSTEKKDRRDKKESRRRQEEDTPAKLLDDLFRKTKTTPCIYWLPLTEEQIRQKEEERRQWKAEREKLRKTEDRENLNRRQRQKEREGRGKGTGGRSRSPARRR